MLGGYFIKFHFPLFENESWSNLTFLEGASISKEPPFVLLCCDVRLPPHQGEDIVTIIIIMYVGRSHNYCNINSNTHTHTHLLCTHSFHCSLYSAPFTCMTYHYCWCVFFLRRSWLLIRCQLCGVYRWVLCGIEAWLIGASSLIQIFWLIHFFFNRWDYTKLNPANSIFLRLYQQFPCSVVST